MKIAMFIILSFLNLHSLNSRPVSYKDSWTVMSYNDYDRSSFIFHYSPTSKYSLGYNAEYWQEKEYWVNALNLNYLIKRINKKKSQVNFYIKTGLGLLSTDYEKYSNKREYVSYWELAADWETRKLFTSFKSNTIKSESVDSTFMQKLRLGFAPYLAKYGALHTWLMYELNHMPENSENYISNFILRFFKSTNLVEIGLNQKKNTTFNFIKRF